MNHIDMAGMNTGNPVGGMPMMHNNMQNGAMPRQPGGEQQQPQQSENEKLNTWIYSYLMEQKQYDVARALKSSNLVFYPPILTADDEVNGVTEDSKHGVLDKQKPPDLPVIKHGIDQDGASLLSGWFAVFWDTWSALSKRADATKAATQLIEQNRMRGQGRGDQMFRAMNGMVPNQMDPKFQQMMRMGGGDLRQTALQNQQQNGFRLNPQMQMAMQQRNALMQQQQQHPNMRRDPSGMEMNGQRPHTPSSGDHAPSPKRPRMDGAGFNPQQMMQNGRPPPGMPPQMLPENSQATQQANALLVTNGINPANLSDSQFASFQSQQPSVQQKSIQVYAQNMAKNQRDDPMGMAGGAGGPDYYGANGQMMRPGAMGPNPGANGQPGNHALQDYQMQLMLLEQQNKKRLLMARQEQDGPGPIGFAPNMSPSGSRTGASPGPGDGGSMRGSPAAMNNFNAVQPPDLFGQMNPGVRGPPSSNPGFNGQFNPQMQQMRPDVAGRMPNGNWQAPPGQLPMNQQASMQQQQQQQPNQQQPQQPQPNQHPQLGTPQPRNAMPPPQAPPAGATNGRNGGEDAPPTPQQTNKSNPKTKKDSKKPKGEGKGKKASNSVAATPASEADNPPPTPTPSTPITPSHPSSFNQKEPPQASSNQVNGNASVQMQVPPQDINVQQFNANGGNDEVDANYGSFNDIQPDNLLDNFNFEEFLDNNAYAGLDLSAVELTDMMEPAMTDV